MYIRKVRAFFARAFLSFIFSLIVVMLVDSRNRTSSAPVKVPPKYQAYVYKWCDISEPLYKVVLAASSAQADSYIHDWCIREGIQHDAFFYFVACVDYEVVGIADEAYFRNLLFPEDVPFTD